MKHFMKYQKGALNLMYAYKEKYTLDFSNVEQLSDFHQIIQKKLDFPDYYGANWDAFWDCLTDRVDVDEPMNIEIIGVETLEQKLPGEFDQMISILKELKHWDSDRYINVVKIEAVIGNARYTFE